MTHQLFLEAALNEAETAYHQGEVPVGAVVVKGQDIIARAHNEKEQRCDTTAHAESLAIRRAAEALGDWRLNGCVLYSTLEPCPMCFGAILHARVDTVYYGAPDKKWGACGTVVDLSTPSLFNHHTQVINLNNERCASLLTQFFKERRQKTIDKHP